MNKEFEYLKEKIDFIKTKGWILIDEKGYGAVGRKFERELGLTNNDLSVADFCGIELKAKRYSSKFPISLFNCTCDGPSMFELKNFVNRFGAINKQYGTKILYITLSCAEYKPWGRNLKMKLYVDRKTKRLYIIVSHANGKIIEKSVYWEFASLHDVLLRKLRYLCFISYDTCYTNGNKYATFFDERFLVYTDFEKFLALLENGDIFVNIKVGIYKSGKKEGGSHDHGTSFQIKRSTLEDLFDHFVFEQKK